MDNWLALLKNLPQDREQLKPYLNHEHNFIDFLTQEYPLLAETVRREIERNLSTRKGLKFIDLLLEHKDPMLRKWGLELVALLPGENRIPRLLTAFGDRDEGIKLIAASKLGCMRSLEVVKALIKGLEDDRWLPARIAQALSSMQDFGVPQLIELTKGDNEKLRRYAVEILAQIGTVEAGQAVLAALADSCPDVRKIAVKVLENLQPEVSGPELLLAFSREQDAQTKIQMIRAITKLELFQATPTLEREQNASDPKLAQAARRALESLRLKQGVV